MTEGSDKEIGPRLLVVGLILLVTWATCAVIAIDWLSNHQPNYFHTRHVRASSQD